MKNNLSIKTIQSLRDIGVLLVYVFGSFAENTNGPLSDLDIGVLFEHSVDLRNKNSLYHELYITLADEFPGKNLDIVFLNTASLELRTDVITYGRVLYEALKYLRLDFEENTLREYADFKPHLTTFNKAILARV